VHERPRGFEDSQLTAALLRHWSISVVTLRYLPVGFGGYHWLAVGEAGERWFVTVTELASLYGGDLIPAMETAAELAAAGLDFVVAPARTAAGPAVATLGADWGVTVFPYITSTPGSWGDDLTSDGRLAVIEMLATLHAASPPAMAPVRRLQLAGRDMLAAALADLGRPWPSGPFGEPSRQLLAEHAARLTGALDRFDALTASVRAYGGPAVITHGEPHPGNLLHDGTRFLLLDWDTVGTAPRERDLWSLLTSSGAEAAAYAELTGQALSQDAVDLYRLRWPLEDLSLFVAELRAPHQRNADTETSFRGLAESLEDLRQKG